MKWLFATLVGLNLIVFAGMIASKIYKNNQSLVQMQSAQQSMGAVQQPPVVINVGQQPVATVPANLNPAQPNGRVVEKSAVRNNVIHKPIAPSKPIAGQNLTTISASKVVTAHAIASTDNNTNVQSQEKYRNCSAKVSMPEDDYHRIKGLLRRFPHAATRQVVQGSEEENGQISARMNVLFMSVNDEEAGAIQGIVGRYGTLHRTSCR